MPRPGSIPGGAFILMTIRIGVEPGRRFVLAAVRKRGTPVLVSANALWDNRGGKFGSKWRALAGLDIALDSGGFVATKLYGRYRYSVKQYVELAGKMRPAWWAAMDYCCEPEIAGDAATVQARVDATVDRLIDCMAEAIVQGVTMPIPVLQGWKPKDYVRCAGLLYKRIFTRPEHWPAMVGVGSVCRRHLRGENNLFHVIDALNWVLPPHVKLHLFGVKGAALAKVSERVGSMDSMAWNMAARWHAFHAGVSCNDEMRADFMEGWLNTQLRHIKKKAA